MNTRAIQYLIILAFLFGGACKKKIKEKNRKGPELIGVFNEELNQLTYLSDRSQDLAEALGGEVMDTSAYFSFGGKDYNAAALGLSSLYPLHSGYAGFYPQGINIPLILKIYVNADCNRNHPGFISPCMGTFGPHRARGNSMFWTVNNWTSCGPGDSVCIEMLRVVGNIEYHQDRNCLDTLFTRVNIVRFACP